MMTKTEAQVQKEIVHYCKGQGWWVSKIMRASELGVPDLIVCADGVFIGCEVKAEKFLKKPDRQMSEWQVKQASRIEDSDGIAICVASLEQFISELEDVQIY